DEPGTLSADRDPPGFEAAGIPAASPRAKPEPAPEPKPEPKRAEDERRRIAAERQQLATALQTAKAELHDHEREAKRLEHALAAAADKVRDAQQVVDDLERKLREART